MKNDNILKFSLSILFFVFFTVSQGMAQRAGPYARVVEIEIKSNYLEEFKAALKEDIEAAVKNEKGVMALYAVYDNNVPNHITVFEVFVNKEAHKKHQNTEYFKKYKSKTSGMVLSTARREVTPIVAN